MALAATYNYVFPVCLEIQLVARTISIGDIKNGNNTYTATFKLITSPSYTDINNNNFQYKLSDIKIGSWISGVTPGFAYRVLNVTDVNNNKKTCKLEFVDSQTKNDHTILWFRSPEENEKVLDFIDESEEDDDLPF